MIALADEIEALVGGESCVVSVSRGEEIEFERGYGPADRAHRIPVATDTQFAIASGTKGFTAAAVVSLIADGTLALDSPARKYLGTDLPLIHDEVTVELLLTHRSGIGDYVDEDLPDEVPLKVPVQDLDRTEAYLPALDGFSAKFAPGSAFSYCNSGYVVLALIAERATGVPFPDLVRARVLEPAGMADTAFLRSDQLPGRAAIGYLEDGRTNVFAVPVRGSGDGGAYTTVADLRAFWMALFGARIVPDAWARRMTAPAVERTGHPFRYGMGFWLDQHRPLVMLEGCDHGASLRSVHDPGSGRTVTVVANTTEGAFPIARALRERFF